MAKWKSTTTIRSSVQQTQIIDTIFPRGLASKAISTEAQWAVFAPDQVTDNKTKDFENLDDEKSSDPNKNFSKILISASVLAGCLFNMPNQTHI